MAWGAEREYRKGKGLIFVFTSMLRVASLNFTRLYFERACAEVAASLRRALTRKVEWLMFLKFAAAFGSS